MGCPTNLAWARIPICGLLALGRDSYRGRGLPLTSDTSNAVNDVVNHLFADGVVPTGVVVGSIFLATDQKSTTPTESRISDI